ncbi:UDP-glucuronate 4-epimerase 1, partial [Zea mays]
MACLAPELWSTTTSTRFRAAAAASSVLQNPSPRGVPAPCPSCVGEGVAGFVGAHCSLALRKHGDGIVGIVGIDSFNSYYDPSLKKARRALLGSHGVFVMEGDINDGRLLAKLFDVVPFTHVLHLAAQAGLRYAMENPAVYVHSNIVGLVSLLEAARTPTRSRPSSGPPPPSTASTTASPSLGSRGGGIAGGRRRGHGAGDPGPPHPPPSLIRHQRRSRRWK